MNKLVLSALGVLTVALLVWALMPADEAPIDGPSVAPSATPAAAAGDAPTAAAGQRAAPVTAAGAGKPSAGGAAEPDPAGGTPPRLAPPRLAPPLLPMPEGEIRPQGEGRYGRKPDSPMPRLSPADFKATVRRYYGNLPRTGRMPARITVEELFPPAVYEGLGVPRDSQVVEIGHHPATGPEGLTEALELPDDGFSTFGVTVVTPDGQRIRDYVQLTTEPADPQ